MWAAHAKENVQTGICRKAWVLLASKLAEGRCPSASRHHLLMSCVACRYVNLEDYVTPATGRRNGEFLQVIKMFRLSTTPARAPCTRLLLGSACEAEQGC
jgi:hypothetical protein